LKPNTRIERLGTLELVGVTKFGNPEKVAFSSAWEHFGKIADEANISRIGKDLYGLQIYSPWFPNRLEITYLASIVRGRLKEIPIRMLSKTLPSGKYAVAKVEGEVNGIDEAIKHLYQEYIPNNGYRVALPLDFEKYCTVKDHISDPSDIEVWVPIESN